MVKVLDVDGAARRVRGGWTATGRPWHYDAERYARVAKAREQEQQAMRDYVATTGCRLEFLRRQLDDEQAAPCGRCDACAGPRHDGRVDPAALDAARAALGRPGVDVEPRRMWPTGMTDAGIELKGRIPAGEQAAVGRALGRLSDIGWGNRLRPLLASDAADGPVPDDVFNAVVQVLASWGWERRPAGVVTMASHSRPVLIDSLGTRLAEVGRLPFLGRIEYAPHAGPAPARSNSAQRLRALAGAFTVPPALASALAGVDGAPVLLVDDRADSKWTLTVAARLLRRAGAGEVLPLVLAVEG
jgi:ATP-dependent DNA helicase RecQ